MRLIDNMLSKKSLSEINVELRKYPDSRSAILSALRIAQVEHGWLSEELIKYVADYLKIPAVQAFEVATFYSMFNLQKTGTYTLTICTNVPCALSGSIDTADYLKNKLGIDFGETTADGRYTLVESECMGACGDAPVVLINNHKMCAHMTVDAIERKLVELANECV